MICIIAIRTQNATVNPTGEGKKEHHTASDLATCPLTTATTGTTGGTHKRVTEPGYSF